MTRDKEELRRVIITVDDRGFPTEVHPEGVDLTAVPVILQLASRLAMRGLGAP